MGCVGKVRDFVPWVRVPLVVCSYYFGRLIEGSTSSSKFEEDVERRGKIRSRSSVRAVDKDIFCEVCFLPRGVMFVVLMTLW